MDSVFTWLLNVTKDKFGSGYQIGLVQCVLCREGSVQRVLCCKYVKRKIIQYQISFFFFSSGTCTTWCCPTVFRARMCKNVEVCKVVLLVTCLSYLIVPWAAGFDILFVCPRNIFRIGWDHWWKVPR